MKANNMKNIIKTALAAVLVAGSLASCDDVFEPAP